MKHLGFAAALVALFLAAPQTAQDKPDFSGTWILDRSRSEDPQYLYWGPRRGGAASKEPLIQARWDGQKVVGIKAPHTSYTMAFIFGLSDDRQELLVDSVNPGGIQSTFKESSVSPAYGRRRFVFTRED